MSDNKVSLKQNFTKVIVYGLIRLIWRSCKVSINGDEYAKGLMDADNAFIPCYWHQQHIFCSWYLLDLHKQGLKLGFLISPSKDGDIPAAIVESLNATAIRGSSNRTGAKALRDLYQIIHHDGVSTVTTPDGPTGPIFKFKPGAVMLSQLSQCPILPMAFVAESAWYLKSWDRFIIPKPFSRVTINIGEPVLVPKKLAANEQATFALQLENELNTLGGTSTNINE